MDNNPSKYRANNKCEENIHRHEPSTHQKIKIESIQRKKALPLPSEINKLSIVFTHNLIMLSYVIVFARLEHTRAGLNT